MTPDTTKQVCGYASACSTCDRKSEVSGRSIIRDPRGVVEGVASINRIAGLALLRTIVNPTELYN